jgi:hypothetical protein
MVFNLLLRLIFFVFLFLSSVFSLEQGETETIPLAFPSAEGFGKYASGGRGGMVYIVTNLNDSGLGSLRWALEANGPRTVVFEVSGNIVLSRPINVRNPHLTIAGQTAPGEGITISNHSCNFVNMHNVIVRFIRFRPGDTSGKQGNAGFGVYMDNAIFDHCTFSWGTDEVASFYAVRNFTMQWSIISEALNNSIHSKGPHGFGVILGGKGVSWHHNLLVHATQRMPAFDHSGLYKSAQEIIEWRGVTDFRNNVIYNWRDRSGSGGAEGTFNVINNYFKPGPSTQTQARNFILNPLRTGNGKTFAYGKFYLNGNVLEGNASVSKNNWLGARLESTALSQEFLESVKAGNPFPLIEGLYYNLESAEMAYEKVLSFAGACLFRDPIDTRIVQEARSGGYTFKGSKGSLGGIIDSQKDVGGWPDLKSAPAPLDSDRDGMPDAWEIEKGLNPERRDDRFFDLDPNYTNLEVYLNSLVAHLMGN